MFGFDSDSVPGTDVEGDVGDDEDQDVGDMGLGE